MSRKPFTVLVSIPLKPGRAAEFLDDVFDAMKVEDTFVNATALRKADDPDTIMLVETWFDRENFMSEQLKRPYRAQYEARLPESVPRASVQRRFRRNLRPATAISARSAPWRDNRRTCRARWMRVGLARPVN